MVKLDYDRDYYADLDLSPPADTAEVKKQFKKLALKWHPDRNPGKEEAAKEKFLVIQAAHEILSDPVNKSKYDAYRQRTTNRYPAASGVRGNPWQYAAQEVNQKYGAPPRRPPATPARPPAPTATSTKYWDWAQKTKPKPDNARANMDAWDRARPQTRPAQPSTPAGSGARTYKQREPPPPPPRTAAQARRQDAAFGTRKSGYAPASPVGDEPPVRNPHYNTSAYTAAPNADTAQTSRPRPTSAFVDPLTSQFADASLDNRQRTPYAANVGEKTNPFEPLNINRAKSMRDGARRFPDGAGEAPPPPPTRQRSASVGSDNFKKSTNEEASSFNGPNPRPTAQFQSRASARYSPRGPETSSAPPTATFADPNSSSSSVNSGATAAVNGDGSEQARNGAKVYESPFLDNRFHAFKSFPTAGPGLQTPHSRGRVGAEGLAGSRGYQSMAYFQYLESARPAPSGGTTGGGGNPFEAALHAQLQHLIHKNHPKTFRSPVPLDPVREEAGHGTTRTNKRANGAYPPSFSVPDDDDLAAQAQQARFTRNSADNINTRFVADERGDANFQFSAGAATASTDDGFLRAKQRARGYHSPLRNEFTPAPEPPSNGTQQAETSKRQGDFDPEQWEKAFGPHVFEPPQTNKPSVSPTRPIRPIKKPRPVRMTAGTAGMVDEDETSGEERAKAGAAPPPGGINGSRSPNAMDIDTPPPEQPPAGQPEPGPRNIHVEPTNPEWRAGNANANGAANPTEPKLGDGLRIPTLNIPHSNTGGSEDSEEFLRPMFSEFRNVEPFAQKPAGLASFADLSANLPFPSRASAKAPVGGVGGHDNNNNNKPRQLEIPSPPLAPRAPASLCIPGTKPSAPAWTTYVRDFEAYLAAWFEFNRKVTDHFAARQKLNENKGFAWLNAQGDGGVHEYLGSLEVDKTVRQRWMAACEAHELHFREFMGWRERMVGGLN